MGLSITPTQVSLQMNCCSMNLINCFKKFCAGFFLIALISGCGEESKPLLQVGEKALPFTLELIGGQQIQLGDYAGKGLVITFMSSWCPCSNESMPFMKQAYATHQNDQIVFLMIGIQDSRSNFEDFVKKWNPPFPAGYDKKEIVKRAFYGNIAKKPDEFQQWVKEII